MISNMKGILLCLIMGNHVIDAYKILIVGMMATKSHHHLDVGVADALAQAGHDVTVISPFSRENTSCREIGVPEMVEFTNSIPGMGFGISKMSLIEMIGIMMDFYPKLAELFMTNNKVKNLLDGEAEKFDLLIAEFYSVEFFIGLGVKYDCPIIILSPITMTSALARTMGNPLSLATVANAFWSVSSVETVFSRIMNFIITVFYEGLDAFILDASQRGLYEKYFPNESKIEPFDEAKNRLSFMLMNTHPSLGTPRAVLPNVVEIGGYHINEPKPLPEDLRKIMDTAENGVIYFSFGSVVRANEMEPEMKQIFLNAFSKLNQTVLWKFEENISHKSENVFIRKWMPQNSILAHPNLKVFITHGGLLSCTEAAHFGVPLISIPVFADQFSNAEQVSRRGQGVQLRLENITESSFEWALNEVLSNPSYAEMAVHTQKIFMDRPMKPKDLIVYYAEHVIRTGGAKHLSHPKMSRWSLLMLDVYAVIMATVTIVFYLIYLSCRILLWSCKKNKIDKNKKLN